MVRYLLHHVHVGVAPHGGRVEAEVGGQQQQQAAAAAEGEQEPGAALHHLTSHPHPSMVTPDTSVL